MTKDQILQEVKNFNMRIHAHQESGEWGNSGVEEIFPSPSLFKTRKPLLTSKNKEELVKSLLKESQWFFEQHEIIQNNIKTLIGCDKEDHPPMQSTKNTNQDEIMITLSDSEDEDAENFKEEEESMIELSDSDDEKAEEPSRRKEIDRSLKEEGMLRMSCLWYFGYSRFRKGQRLVFFSSLLSLFHSFLL